MAISSRVIRVLALCAPLSSGGGRGQAPDPLSEVRGITISCQTWGWEWGTPGFSAELEDLAGLGANWVAIHPYAQIGGDGSVRWREFDPEDPPDWLRVPQAEAARRGFGLMIVPHLAYWGSPFHWRGDIAFEDPLALERFFDEYQAWIVALARATRGARAFVVGTETDRLVSHEARWRELIAAVRAETDAKLTYAANWDRFADVPFWDALDAVGVQAYFPLSDALDPSESDLEAGWERVLEGLHALYLRTGKPVVFTELGYNVSLDAARVPASYPQASEAEREAALRLQERCMSVALRTLARERDWLRGAFLWKWFVGQPRPGTNFLVDTPSMRAVLEREWRRE